MTARGSARQRVALGWVGAVARLVPARERAGWRAEWVAELTHAARRIPGGWRATAALWWRAAGAALDAFTVLRLSRPIRGAAYAGTRARLRLALAAGCLGLAAAGVTIGIHAGLAAEPGPAPWAVFGLVALALLTATGQAMRALAPRAQGRVALFAGFVAGPLALGGMLRLDLPGSPGGGRLAALASLILLLIGAARAVWYRATVIALALALLPHASAGQAAQGPDSAFDPAVARPAWPRGMGPRVVIDEAHLNFHRAGGRFRPFAQLLRNDGLRVEPGRARFSAGSLGGAHVLVIANALGDSAPAGAGRPAFDSTEVEAVHDWVEGGGSLLLVADHEPFGAAAATLARRFGVDMSTGRTYDDPHSDWSSGSPSWLVYQRDTGALIVPHPVTDGRDSTERVRRVVTFTGQSLLGPPGSIAFLALASSAQDRLPDGRDVPAAGRAQGIAMEVGRGRVVVLAEAGMLTAQVVSAGGRSVRFGLTWPNTDDRQLALNVMRWLARLGG